MKQLSSKDIREKFLSFFEKNKHLKIQSSSILPHNDPTLLFINSGMAPLKNYFLGKEEPPQKRLCNFQPCIRTKDIDDVGDRHHLTIFEMMGSWSIGDYYKELACELAYKLLVDEFEFDPNKLYMTVYKGNEKLGIPADNASVEAWKKVGVKEDHIVMMGDDNFWGPAGDSGPCGPCTEVFYDTGAAYGPEYKPGGHFDDVGRYIEIWNAGVFMEYNKAKDGSFTNLPLKSVDTGSGLERLAMVMNNCESVYETDLMKPIMDEVSKLFPKNEDGEVRKRKTRMITDHLRASTFILAEGVTPSNEGQGYIPRRLIRKSVAALLSEGQEKINFNPIVEKVLEILSPYYIQLNSAKDAILFSLKNEIDEFVPIVKNGLKMIDEELEKKNKIFSGKFAFELVTTHGLPLEVIQSTLEDKSIPLNIEEYEKCYEEHRRASRVIGNREGETTDLDTVESLLSSHPDTVFTGYSECAERGKVLAIIQDGKSVKSLREGSGFVLTDKTPFYAESGGQIGDMGTINSGIDVKDTLKMKNHHVHLVQVRSGELEVGEEAHLVVDKTRRESIKRNHSATHLMHAALHEVVGKHATQKGSLVTEEKLRFDFQHNKPLTSEEIVKIEDLVNGWIRDNYNGAANIMAYDKAIESGAMALFGEKYESDVRVISFGQSSVELCGGTHVNYTGEIGLFAITTETSVAKGVRRIEAVTGANAVKLFQEQNSILKSLCREMNAKPEMLLDRIKESQKKGKEKREVKSVKDIEMKNNNSFNIGEVNFIVAQVDEGPDNIKLLGDDLLSSGKGQIICLIGADDKSVKTFCWVKKEFSKKVKAGELLKRILSPIEGKGGGPPHFAQGGSPQVKNVSKVFSSLESEVVPWLKENL